MHEVDRLPGASASLAWFWRVPSPANVPLLRALWSLLDGIWGVLKGSGGVLVQDPVYSCADFQTDEG